MSLFRHRFFECITVFLVSTINFPTIFCARILNNRRHPILRSMLTATSVASVNTDTHLTPTNIVWELVRKSRTETSWMSIWIVSCQGDDTRHKHCHRCGSRNQSHSGRGTQIARRNSRQRSRRTFKAWVSSSLGKGSSNLAWTTLR